MGYILYPVGKETENRHPPASQIPKLSLALTKTRRIADE
jgi:hypothetical protein